METAATPASSVAYVTDAQGQRTAVLVPYAEWLALQQKLKELQISRDEAVMRASLTEAFRDIADMEAGRKPKVLLADFLDELDKELAAEDGE